MVTALTRAAVAGESRVVLRDVSWDTYDRLVSETNGNGGPRLTYDHGYLEIMSPLSEHEESKQAINLLVEEIAVEWDRDIRNLGSVTLRREDLGRGSEPDSCYYIARAPELSGRTRIDLATDPPPDLVIEIDYTNPTLDKLALYASLGVPEVWRYEPGGRLTIHRLQGEGYAEDERSSSLAPLTHTDVERFMAEAATLSRPAWVRHVREWARQNRPGDTQEP